MPKSKRQRVHYKKFTLCTANKHKRHAKPNRRPFGAACLVGMWLHGQKTRRRARFRPKAGAPFPAKPSAQAARPLRCRTRVVGSFPDGNSALMLVCARLRHMAGTQWGNKKYMNMKHLDAFEDASIAGWLLSCQACKPFCEKFLTLPTYKGARFFKCVKCTEKQIAQ